MREKKDRSLKCRVTAAILFLMLLMTVSCKGGSVNEAVPDLMEPVGVSIDTAVVTRGEMSDYVSYKGSVEASVTKLYFEVDGTVEDIPVYPGQHVEKGDVLVTLDHESIQKSMASLQENIDNITQNGAYEDRISDLNIQLLEVELQEIKERSGADSKDYQLKQLDIEEVKLNKKQQTEVRDREIKALEEQLTELKSRSDAQVLKAPFAGNIYYESDFTKGSFVKAFRTVMRLIDPEDKTFIVEELVDNRVVDSDTTYAWIGSQSWSMEYQPLSAEEKYEYYKMGSTPPYYFKFKEDAGASLPSAGSFGVLIGEIAHYEDVLTIPINALFSESGQSYVYVIESNGGRTRRDVTVGPSNNLRTIIKEGLEEGEIVYVAE